MYIFSGDYINYYITNENPLTGPVKWEGPMSKEAADYAMAQQHLDAKPHSMKEPVFFSYKHEWEWDWPWDMVDLKDWFYAVNTGKFGDIFLHVRIFGIRSKWTIYPSDNVPRAGTLPFLFSDEQRKFIIELHKKCATVKAQSVIISFLEDWLERRNKA